MLLLLTTEMEEHQLQTKAINDNIYDGDQKLLQMGDELNENKAATVTRNNPNDPNDPDY